LFVLWYVGDMCDMAYSDKDHIRSRRPGAEDRGWSSIGRILGGRTVERSGDIVCGLHSAYGDEERGFLGLTLKLRSTVCQWFSFKTTGTGFPIWASKPVATV
jgi:hypothetical protein